MSESLTTNQLFIDTVSTLSTVIQGKDLQIKKSLACLLASGHILFEDLPGTGKTSIAQALSKVLGLDYSRIQFTSDLLPADVLGAMIFEQSSNQFHFQKGPVFTQLLLADEINRSSAKTQSALLEAMAEEQITVDGDAYPLDKPFFVIATQNPQSQFGTFPLPESQLDRFMLSVSIGYPDFESEKSLLRGDTGRGNIAKLASVLNAETILSLREEVKSVHCSDSLLDYVLRLVKATRSHVKLSYGISPRGALALVEAAKAWAFIHQRDYVIPEDVQALLMNAWQHRLLYAASSSIEAGAIIEQILENTVVNV